MRLDTIVSRSDPDRDPVTGGASDTEAVWPRHGGYPAKRVTCSSSHSIRLCTPPQGLDLLLQGFDLLGVQHYLEMEPHADYVARWLQEDGQTYLLTALHRVAGVNGTACAL